MWHKAVSNLVSLPSSLGRAADKSMSIIEEDESEAEEENSPITRRRQPLSLHGLPRVLDKPSSPRRARSFNGWAQFSREKDRLPHSASEGSKPVIPDRPVPDGPVPGVLFRHPSICVMDDNDHVVEVLAENS